MTSSQSPPFFPVRFQGPTGRVSRGPVQPRTHPTWVFAALVANTQRADAPPEAALRAGCAPGAPGRGGQRPRGLRWDKGPALWRRGGGREDGAAGVRSRVPREKATRGKGAGQGEQPKTRGALGGAGPASWVSGPGGHAVIPALKPRAEMRGLETRVLPGVKAGTLAPQAVPLLQKRVQSQTHELGNVRTRTGRPGSALYKTGN